MEPSRIHANMYFYGIATFRTPKGHIMLVLFLIIVNQDNFDIQTECSMYDCLRKLEFYTILNGVTS